MKNPPDYIVVLGSGYLRRTGKFPEVAHGMYLGGHTRMEAAARLNGRYPAATLILVGGREGENSKARDMERFLRKENPKVRTLCLDSLPCTRHNLIAVFEKYGEKLAHKKVALLTNSYHLPRALLLWRLTSREMKIPAPRPIPLPAERFYKPKPSARFAMALKKRIASERRGIRDIMHGRYIDHCTPR